MTQRGEQKALRELLAEASISLAASASNRDDAIRQAGAGLVAVGAVRAEYVDSMIDRENSVSTYMGEAIAIPHATLAAKGSVLSDAISMMRFPDGVDWNGHDVRVAFGIAATQNGHIALLSRLAAVLMNPATASALRAATTIEQVYALLESETTEL